MFCEVCDEPSTKVCSGCHTIGYCSDKCQKADWKSHKGKACEMHRVLYEINKENAEKKKPKPAKNRCTGCNVKFDEEDYYVDQECPDCGYMTCESCSASNSRGTCNCSKSNFGHPYCDRVPQPYHTDGYGRSYKGDRHPEAEPGEFPDEIYEDEERACDNCGTVGRMWKKEYC